MIYHCPVCGNWHEDHTIIDEWKGINAPPAPELKAICLDPRSSALLVLDMETTICNNDRCIASICKINDLLVQARERGMLVVYSLTHTGNVSDIAPQLSPIQGEPIVKSNVDKFYNTNLEQILHEHSVKTVIITGYAANGAVLHTATSAAFRGFNVIIPVDGMTAANPYAEQYTAWHMLNSPGTRNKATLTKINLIQFCRW
ncbi:nicotinamidase-related amidase [Paenibacillus castaneae]|uniref:cysteine hydrolase n=1 Tax=Paenibacillus castaneae TaxID=474957 RepID=UPI000C9B4129|nr:cysteine hydrolase [Paenibacillus castaneae]NIK75476.1 nicotinamidase-related amidase [Paenibacillus castaneae]